MKILFTHSYFLHFDPKQLEMSKPYPPLGTIQAAACARESGNLVNLYDPFFATDPKEITPSLTHFKPDLLVIYDDGFNYLTKMCLTRMRDAAHEMIQLATALKIPVWVVSSDSTDHYTEYLEKGAQAILLGEAEETLLEAIETIEKGGDLSAVKGLAWKNQNEIVKNPPRLVMKNLDDLPIPAWDLIQIEEYQNAWSKHGYFSVNLATTRGCPYKCNWCAKPIYGNRYNSRSPKHVVKELKQMQLLFQFDHIWFADDIFGLKPNWVQEFDKVLKEEQISIVYKIQSRADLLLKDDTIACLKSSGCEEVWIGAESGSQKILDAMDKGTEVGQIYEATRLMKKHGVKPCFFLQFGYLGEEWKDIKATLEMVFELMPYDIGVSVSYPLPGTKFYDLVKNQLQEKANWIDSDELLLMYESTYQPGFYKRLHRFIHKRFRQKQMGTALKKGKLTAVFRWGYFFLFSRVDWLRLLLLRSKKNVPTPQSVVGAS